MYNTWTPYLYLSLFLALVGVCEILYRVFKIHPEFTRKILHFTAGVLILAFPFAVKEPFLAILFCIAFTALLFFSKKHDFFPSIHRIERHSYGIYYTPFIFIAAYLMYYYYQQYTYFYIPLLILAISDALAAVIGQIWPYKPYILFGHKKTLAGSTAFFISAFLISYICLGFFEQFPTQTNLAASFAIALTSAVVEAISSKGIDNLSIPLTVAAMLYLFNEII